MYYPIYRRSKPIKDQFYDDIFPRDYLDDETDDEDEVIPLPTQAKVDQMHTWAEGGELARISPPQKNFWKNIPPLQEGHSLANSPPKLRKNVIFPP